jgi:hypothetical protein
MLGRNRKSPSLTGFVNNGLDLVFGQGFSLALGKDKE